LVSRWLLLVVVVAFGVVAGWWLLRPQTRVVTRRVEIPTNAQQEPTVAATPLAEATATVTEAPEVTPAPETATTPEASATPSLAPTPAPGERSGRLALIVDDCGQWIDTERGFIALQIPLTLSVLPDVPYTGEIAREAAVAGKGVMLHLPMETVSGLNPGPGKITTAMSDPQITKQVEEDLSQVPLARGVNNHEGSKASADERVMRDVIGVLAQRGGLFFVDSRTNAASVGESTAEALGVPAAARDVFLDNRNDVAYAEGQLLEAATIARRTGHAIAIGHPRPATLEAVREMIPRLTASGIEFVLVQDMVVSER
jgi:uncharacterized protein